MDSLLRTSTFLAVCLLVVHYVAEIHGGAACDSPNLNNKRPVNVTEEEYAKYCCEAIGNGSFTAASRFDCASEGGCCGKVDKQYCCDDLYLVVGFCIVVVFILPVITMFAAYLYFYRQAAGYSCKDCCKGRDRPLDMARNNGTRTYTGGDISIPRPSVYRTTRPTASISFHHEPHTDPVSTIAMPPTAPPAYVPPDAPPPSYTEVMRNPHVFICTEKGNAI